MATIFKPRYTKYRVNGRRISAVEARQLMAAGVKVERLTCQAKKWYIRYRLPDGRWRTVPGYTDKQATMALQAKLLRDAEREASGLTVPTDRFLHDPIEAHLADYQRDIEARGCTEQYIHLTRQRILTICQIVEIKQLADITAPRIQQATKELRQRGLSIESVNHYLVAIKMFSRWLWRQGRWLQDPLAGLSRQNADVERRRVRRALTDVELSTLITTTQQSTQAFRGLTGPDRAALYVLAAGSGLRARELASIRRVDLVLDGDPPTVTVRAGYSKHRQHDTIPLPQNVAEYLAQWLAQRPTRPIGEAVVWPGSWWQRAAVMLRRDLKAAGIPANKHGTTIDFHALRASYATLLARQGVNLQTAQALMRHSDPKLTARTYTKLGITDLGAAVQQIQVAPLEKKGSTQARRKR